MASIKQMETKDGKRFFKISVSRGYGKSAYTTRWYWPDGWSKKAAEREVNQRISFSDSEEPLEFTAKYSLRIISDSDHFVSSSQLANEMLAASDNAY